jgi:hypothetical protein
MVINNFNIFGTSFCPSKANATLPVNTDAVLPGSVAFERFQSVSWRYSQILKVSGNFKLPQFSTSDRLEVRESLDSDSLRKCLGIGTLEGADHTENINACPSRNG